MIKDITQWGIRKTIPIATEEIISKQGCKPLFCFPKLRTTSGKYFKIALKQAIFTWQNRVGEKKKPLLNLLSNLLSNKIINSSQKT